MDNGTLAWLVYLRMWHLILWGSEVYLFAQLETEQIEVLDPYTGKSRVDVFFTTRRNGNCRLCAWNGQ